MPLSTLHKLPPPCTQCLAAGWLGRRPLLLLPAPRRWAPQPAFGKGELPASCGARLPGCGLLNQSNQIKSLGHLLNSGLRGSPFFSFQRLPGRTPSVRDLQGSALNYTKMERAGRQGHPCRRRGAERSLPRALQTPRCGENRCVWDVQMDAPVTTVGSWLRGGSLRPRSSPALEGQDVARLRQPLLPAAGGRRGS